MEPHLEPSCSADPEEVVLLLAVVLVFIERLTGMERRRWFSSSSRLEELSLVAVADRSVGLTALAVFLLSLGT